MKTTTDIQLSGVRYQPRGSRPAVQTDGTGDLPADLVSLSGELGRGRPEPQPAVMTTAVRSLLRPAGAVAIAVVGFGLSRLLHRED
ncbi:MAG: hypothetical protein HY319_19150 [Armatimonadetes bacterium]|nr:hypothetical protein [Armatimonadota bacterium]